MCLTIFTWVNVLTYLQLWHLVVPSTSPHANTHNCSAHFLRLHTPVLTFLLHTGTGSRCVNTRMNKALCKPFTAHSHCLCRQQPFNSFITLCKDKLEFQTDCRLTVCVCVCQEVRWLLDTRLGDPQVADVTYGSHMDKKTFACSVYVASEAQNRWRQMAPPT